MKMAYFLPFACSIAASGYFQWRWRSLNGLRALRLPHQKTVSDLLESTDFPTEKSAVQPGPFSPTTFALNGHTWGIIICYEGVYPSLTGNYAQMDALVAAGPDAAELAGLLR